MFHVRDDGGVRWLTADYPGRRNAIPPAGWPLLRDALVDFDRSEARCLIIMGAGEDFCAGADLGADLGSGGIAAATAMMAEVGAAATALHDVSKPVVAAVDGAAVGAGMNMALGCDFAICAEGARFSEIFVKRGLTVDFGGTWLLPRRVGMGRAKELALTGRIVGAAEALTLGLVVEVVPRSHLVGRAAEIGASLAAGAPLAQRFIKRGLDRSFEMTFGQALAYEDQAQALLMSSEDVAEGVAAFLQKRDPDFKGR